MEEAESALVEALDTHACFVAGRWVALSEDVCSVRRGTPPVFRDALLVLIAHSKHENNGVLRSEVCEALSVKNKHVLQILEPMMRLNRNTGLWEFKIGRDDYFLAKYGEIGNSHQKVWESKNKRRTVMDALKEDLSKGLNILPLHAASASFSVESSYRAESVAVAGKSRGVGFSNKMKAVAYKDSEESEEPDNYDDDADEVLMNGVEKEFEVDSSGNTDGGIGKGTDSITSANLISELFIDALQENGVMTHEELVDIINVEDVSAVNLSGALETAAEIVFVAGKKFYVTRVHENDPYGRLRKVVVALFDQRGQDGSLKKSEIMKGAEAAGLGNISNQLYLRVLKDVATAQKSIWTWKWGE